MLELGQERLVCGPEEKAWHSLRPAFKLFPAVARRELSELGAEMLCQTVRLVVLEGTGRTQMRDKGTCHDQN